MSCALDANIRKLYDTYIIYCIRLYWHTILCTAKYDATRHCTALQYRAILYVYVYIVLQKEEGRNV